MKRAIIVDIDGTIALNVSNRPFYGKGAAEGMLTDEPLQPVIDTAKLYCKQTDSDLIIVTGRECTPEIKNATEWWLSNQGIVPDLLLMRPLKNYTPAAECKKLLYDTHIKGKYDIAFALEDNDKCIEMWENEGIYCIQIPPEMGLACQWELPNDVAFDGWAKMNFKYFKEGKRHFVEFLLSKAESLENKILALKYISTEELLPKTGWSDDMPNTFIDCSYEEPELFSRHEIVDFYTNLRYIYDYLIENQKSTLPEEELWETLVDEVFEYVKQNRRIGTKFDW